MVPKVERSMAYSSVGCLAKRTMMVLSMPSRSRARKSVARVRVGT